MPRSHADASAEPFDEVHIRQVLRTPCRSLVPQQRLAIEKPHRNPVELTRDLGCPRLVERDGIQASQQIHTVRCAPELNHAIVCHEVCCIDSERRETEFAQCANYSSAVFIRRSNKAIDVFGEARVAVKCNCMSTNDQKLNVVRAEQSEQLAQILVHSLHGPPDTTR